MYQIHTAVLLCYYLNSFDTDDALRVDEQGLDMGTRYKYNRFQRYNNGCDTRYKCKLMIQCTILHSLPLHPPPTSPRRNCAF